MSYPDEELVELQLSLKDFVSLAGELVGQPNSFPFAQFVLAGRIHDMDEQKRILINARIDAVPPAAGPLRRDIDSAIGITRDLPFNKPLAVYAVASFSDTLTKDNHLRREIHLPGVSSKEFICLDIAI